MQGMDSRLRCPAYAGSTSEKKYMKPNILYLCAFPDSVTMSYFTDYADAFARAGALVVNLGSEGTASQASRLARIPWARIDRVVFGYSFFYGISRHLVPVLAAWLRFSGKRSNVFFMQNEYRLFQDKLNMAARLSCAFVTTQLCVDSAQRLYAGATAATILPMPHALNDSAFVSRTEAADRPLDIGCRSAIYPPYLGDRMRQDFLLTVQERAVKRGLASDVVVSDDPATRFKREGWSSFLNSCRYTVATEAGAAFLEIDDRTRLAVNDFTAKHPEATFAEIEARFFPETADSISGKCISARHFDAIGTKTCQILLEGRYNDILMPGEHYIEIKRDLSNLDEALGCLGNEEMRKAMVERAHAHVMRYHTIDRRVTGLLESIDSARSAT